MFANLYQNRFFGTQHPSCSSFSFWSTLLTFYTKAKHSHGKLGLSAWSAKWLFTNSHGWDLIYTSRPSRTCVMNVFQFLWRHNRRHTAKFLSSPHQNIEFWKQTPCGLGTDIIRILSIVAVTSPRLESILLVPLQQWRLALCRHETRLQQKMQIQAQD